MANNQLNTANNLMWQKEQLIRELEQVSKTDNTTVSGGHLLCKAVELGIIDFDFAKHAVIASIKQQIDQLDTEFAKI